MTGTNDLRKTKLSKTQSEKKNLKFDYKITISWWEGNPDSTGFLQTQAADPL